MKLTDVLLRDTRANQPDADAVVTGTLFCVTDEGNILEQSDGATWSPYSPEPGDFADLGDIPDTLAAIAALSPIANQGIRFTDGSTAEEIDITDAAVDLLDDADAATMRATLGVYSTGEVDSAIAAASVASLDDIGDVNAPTPSDGDALTWDAGTSKWINSTASAVAALDDLTDVNAPSPSDGYLLAWDAGTSMWVPISPSVATGSLPDWLANHPDAPPASPNAADDEWTEGALDTGGTRFSGATAWAWLNQGTSSLTIANKVLQLIPQADNKMRGIEQAVPAGNYRYRMKLVLRDFSLSGGFWIRRSASNVSVFLGISNTTSVNGEYGALLTSSTGAWTSDVLSASDHQPLKWFGYLELEYNGTNVIYRVSPTGEEGSFTQLYSNTVSSLLGGAPTHIGIGGFNNTSTGTVVCSWWRRMA